MVSYYDIVEGNLRTGDIAKSSDINHIQTHIQDALKKMLSDLHDNQSYILGSGDLHKNDFVITPAKQLLGRYVDSYFSFAVDKSQYIDINHYTVKQPIVLTKTSLYSVITQLRNTSDKDISVDFELQDENGIVLRKNSLVLAKNTEVQNCEIVFDLKYYPTIHNVDFEDIISNDSKSIPLITKEEGYDSGYEQEHEDESEALEASTGATILYFVIKQTNLNAIDLYDNDEESLNFDAYTSLGAYYTQASPAANKDIFLSQGRGTEFEKTERNLWIKTIYSNEPTYKCTGGIAVINGEKVQCLDSHVSIAGANEYGNVLSKIYLGNDGHLYANNSKASTTTDITKFEEDLDDPDPMESLLIAEILTYSNTLGYDKEPLVMQNTGQRPMSHHERIRRLENRLDWTMDKALPSRIKYTLDNKSWLDEMDNNASAPYPFVKEGVNAELSEKLEHYTTSFDSQGNPIIRVTDAIVHNISVTLKEEITSDSKNNQVFDESGGKSLLASKKNMVHNAKTGTLMLDTQKVKSKTSSKVATTAKQAKETKYNPWDDYKGNRPKTTDIKVNKREYVVYKGRNGAADRSSHYPAMTFYTSKKIKLTKLEIPITQFKNCSGMKFFIYKRQHSNNKKNTVWLEQPAIWHTKEMSLKKAKTKGKYQYLDSGFTLTFKDGLTLNKGQYVILCLPIPKGEKGSCFVETFKPQNPKDFCIKYVGNSNASHFRLDDRYPEIWYKKATATVTEEEKYATSGEVVSNTITWTDSTLPRIKTVKPVVSGNLTTGDNASAKLYVDTGGGFQEVTIGKENVVTGSNQSFKWKLEFFSPNGKGTPKLAYDSKDGFALQFVITREARGFSTEGNLAKYNKSICITSKIFDGDDILRQYVGDSNLGVEDSKMSQFEFGRIWAEKDANKNMLIDIQGSDRDINLGTVQAGLKAPYWSFHYCDLTLDDFKDSNVDYDDYTQEMEYDENNLRFKIDPNHSYNDNDIVISNLENFKRYSNDIDTSESKQMTFVTNSEIKKNQLFMKNLLPDKQELDLTKYTGLRFNFKVRSSSPEASLKGVALYISTEEEKPIVDGENNVPSAIRNDPEKLIPLEDAKVLIPEISDDTDYYKYYEGKVIKILHPISKDEGDKAASPGYYQYVPVYNNLTGKVVYRLQQIHDYRSYKIYYLPEIKYDEADTTTLQTDGNDKWVNFNARIEIDQNSQNLKHVREIGLISIHDENEDTGNNLTVTSSNSDTTKRNIILELNKVRAISEDYYPIFDPESQTFTKSKHCEVYKSGAFPFVGADNTALEKQWKDYYATKNIPNSLTLKETVPKTNMINIDYKNIDDGSETLLCYFNNEYDLTNYKHIGIQISSDVYIPKDCFKICLCSDFEGKNEIASINMPTLNGAYVPLDSGSTINLSQLIKKINKEATIKSISIKSTKNCSKILNGTDGLVSDSKSKINLFVGKIVLYKAETIPMFHNRIRYKIYTTDNDGSILRYTDGVENGLDKVKLAIRKLGVICEYK